MKRSEFNAALAASSALVAVAVPAPAAASRAYIAKHKVPNHVLASHRHRKSRGGTHFPSSLLDGGGTPPIIPPETTFGDPVYFAWDRNTGNVTIPGNDVNGEIAKMYDANTKIVYVSLAIPYLHASNYFTDPPDGTAPRVKEVIQFKPTLSQIHELPELQKQPLSWSPVMKFDATNHPNGWMYSGPFKTDAVSVLQAMPIDAGLGAFSFQYAGTALNVNHLLATLDDWLGRLNAIGKVAAGIPGVVISASTIVAFGLAQSVVDQVSAVLSNGRARNELAFDNGSQMFAVSQVSGAKARDTLRIPKDGVTYLIVPGGGLKPNESQADSFYKNLSADNLKVKARASGALYAVHPDGSEAAGFFDPLNYAVIDVTLSDTAPV